MRILFVTNEMPDPKGGGSSQRAFLHLEALRQMGDVTMVLPESSAAPKDYGVAEVIRRHRPTMTEERLWQHEASRSRFGRSLRALLRLNNVDARARPADRKDYAKAIKGPFDLVFAFRLRSAIWLESVVDPASLGGIRVLDLDDIESIVFQKRIADELTRFWRWKFGHELVWLKQTERRVARQWDAISLCAQGDVDTFEGMTGVRAWVVPNATVFDRAEPELQGEITTLLFVGTFSYFPNAQGVDWFVKDIWPIVRKSLGDRIRLQLVGLRPTRDILALADHPGVTVHGDVPDVDPFYSSANIVIAPIRAGSGTRIKLIEAAAKSRAIVTTTLGCEGLYLVDGVHAEIADEAAEFAARIIALAGDLTQRTRRATAAREHTNTRFSRRHISDELTKMLRLFISGQATENTTPAHSKPS